LVARFGWKRVGRGLNGGEDVAVFVAADFDGVGWRLLLHQREVVGADLDGIRVRGSGAPSDFACGERGEDHIDGHLYGVPIFKRRERDGVLTGAVGLNEIASAAVMHAEGFAAQSRLVTLAAAGKDVAAFRTAGRHGLSPPLHVRGVGTKQKAYGDGLAASRTRIRSC
jgi:hypothetical protein